MALRVLLADESATIKKVMQITLQDFDADIQCVSLGTDVLSVTKQNKPDIVFIDILLQKKSGYEVAKEIKNSPECQNIPVIMLWNGFMEFDQEKFDASLANDKLEKPFDSETLRKIILKYVPKSQENPVAAHVEAPPVEWPKQEEEEEEHFDDKTNALPHLATATPKKEEQEKQDWNMDQFDDLPSLDDITSDQEGEEESFQPMKLNELSDNDSFSQKTSNPPKEEKSGSISRFTLDIPKEDLGEFDLNEEEDDFNQVDTSNFLWGNDVNPSEKNEEVASQNEEALSSKKEDAPMDEAPQAPHVTQATKEAAQKNNEAAQKAASSKSTPNLSEAELEAYVREHCKDTIEKLAREMVPKMAKELIQKELDRLLEEEANS